jgi:hypothetical protein
MKIQPTMNGPVVTRYSGITSDVNFDKCNIDSLFDLEFPAGNSMSSYGVSTFEEDVRHSLQAEKVNRLKSKGKISDKNSTSSSTTGARGRVRFSSITIQEYSIEPGMNPGGNKGCPLTIGWNPISTKSLDLDVFESHRCHKRRDNEQLKLVSAQRDQMLLNMGYTMKSILAGTKAANRTRRERFNTLARLNSSESEEMIEGLRRGALNFVTFGNKKRQEQKLMAPYSTESNKDGSVLKSLKSKISTRKA